MDAPLSATLQHTAKVHLCNPRKDTLFVTSWVLPKELAEVKYKFESARLAFRPMAVIEPRSMQLLVRQSKTRLAMLNCPAFSDCQLLTPESGAKPIHVSRAVLAEASPFFHTMFTGPWAESANSNRPITISTSAPILIPCLIHIYSGWLPSRPLPTQADNVQQLLSDHGCDLDRFWHVEWSQLVDFAEMLDLLFLAQEAHAKATECMKERSLRINKALDAYLDDTVSANQDKQVKGVETNDDTVPR